MMKRNIPRQNHWADVAFERPLHFEKLNMTSD